MFATLAWFAILAFAFILLGGEWTAVNWIAAGSLAAIAAALTVPLTRLGLFRLHVEPSWAKQLLSVPKQIFVDFGILTAVLGRSLLHSDRSVGVFVARKNFNTGPTDARGTAWRAFVTVVATLSPNSYVIDIDPESGNRLAHDLVPNRASERPA